MTPPTERDERREAVARALFNFLISYDSGGCCGPSCSTQEVEATSDDLADRILSLLGVAAPLGEQGSGSAAVREEGAGDGGVPLAERPCQRCGSTVWFERDDTSDDVCNDCRRREDAVAAIRQAFRAGWWYRDRARRHDLDARNAAEDRYIAEEVRA